MCEAKPSHTQPRTVLSEIKVRKKKVIFLMGPTAIGKTQVSLCLAKKIKAEIINCDSMQIYRQLNISSSKPPKKARKEITHHLFDFILPRRTYSAYQFALAARREIKEITERDKMPLFVGGSGLYMKAVIDGLFPDTKADFKLRKSLNKISELTLFKRLKKVDPECARVIHPHNKRRIIRALEVYIKNKKPLSYLKKNTESIENKYIIKIFAIDMKREALYERINRRVDEMFRRGLLAEAKKLSSQRISRTARTALGIRELFDYLKGRTTLEEARRLIKRNSRRYAKRQLTWFRADKRITWIKIQPSHKPQQIAKKIIKEIS